MHTRVLMIIPTRGRPAAAAEAARSAIENAALDNTTVLLAVDGCCGTEPPGPGYHAAYEAAATERIRVALDPQHRGMVATLNLHANYQVARGELLAEHRGRCHCPGSTCAFITHVGFMGDDHRIRTPEWDTRLAEAAGPWGIAYGDDLIRGPALPTAVLMSADIVRALHQMVPPTLQHLYVDDYWKALGERTGTLAYVPEVVIEHLHPSAGKAELDDSYRITNHPDRYAADGAAWKEYRATTLDGDAELLRSLRAVWEWPNR